ncbi:hypothetical protein JYT44_01975 [Caldithrix abyssi]|nr:hypothetical protein [Caldithrix abyssi]
MTVIKHYIKDRRSTRDERAGYILTALFFLLIAMGQAQNPGPRSGAVIWYKGMSVGVFWVQQAQEGLYSGTSSVDDPADQSFVRHQFPLHIAYSPYPNVQLFASLPLKYSSRSLLQEGAKQSDQTFGQGDLLLLARYRVYRKDMRGGTNQISVSFGPEIPLGAAQIKDDKGILYPPALQPGTGSWNWLAAVGGAFPRGRWGKGASIMVKWFGENQEGLRRSPWVELNSGALYRVLQKKYPGPQLAIGGGLNYIVSGRAYKNGERLENSGGQRLSLMLPGGFWTPYPWLIVQYRVFWPIWHNVNGKQLGQKGPLVALWVNWAHAF